MTIADQHDARVEPREDPAVVARSSRLTPWLVCSLIACFAASLVVVYLATANQGLWEDGYFAKRFARNFARYHSFSWNVEDGPIYGMTSQTLQVLALGLYLVAPDHIVTNLKAALYVALLLTFFVLGRIVLFGEREPTPSGTVEGSIWERAYRLTPCAIGLSISLVLEVVLMGLETAIALLAVAASILAITACRGTRSDAVKIVVAVLVVYLTRPDAVLIPGVLLLGELVFALRAPIPSWPGAGFLLKTALGIGLGLGMLLGIFYLYYGTSLPLPFYIKTLGVSALNDLHVQSFAPEKYKNALQLSFFMLPFVFIASHARSPRVLLLLAAAATFFAYHYFATIETMGYFSRFYLPALAAVLAAAGLAYGSYLGRRHWVLSVLFLAAWLGGFAWLKRLDEAMRISHMLPTELDIPVLVATAFMLLAPRGLAPESAAVAGLSLLVGSAMTRPIESLRFRSDDAILLDQIRPRRVFRGLEQLRLIQPKVVYHTDMGAPGALLPDARVVDLDGLLNEDITLRGSSFEELCLADRPDAIFVPHDTTYPELRSEILSGDCIQGYRAVTAMNGVPLFIREDRVQEYRDAAR